MGSFQWTRGSNVCLYKGFSKFYCFPSAIQPNSLFRVGIAILVTVLLPFLTGLLQGLLKLFNFLGQLQEVMAYGIIFLSAFLSGTEIGFLLSILFEPTTIMSVVHGIRAPMLLAQVAVLLKTDFLRNPGHRIGTRAFIPFLVFVGRLLGRL